MRSPTNSARRKLRGWKTSSGGLRCSKKNCWPGLLAATPDDDLVGVRAQADRELAPYRSKMPAAQIDQLLKQYIHKRYSRSMRLPRLSLFYMG